MNEHMKVNVNANYFFLNCFGQFVNHGVGAGYGDSRLDIFVGFICND